MARYDYVLAGGGAAGLALAYHLIQSPLGERSMLIVDPDAKERNDRTWCFWTAHPTPFDRIVYRRWDRLLFASDRLERRFELAPYQYQMIRGIDYYRLIRQALAGRPNVTLLRARVERIEDGAAEARVIADGRTYGATWVFDSRFAASGFQPASGRYRHVWQSFRGWLVEAAAPAFDPGVVTLFDLRTPQRGAMRFFYVLPLSERQALIEHTLFSPQLPAEEEYEQALSSYVERVLGVASYRIVEREAGLIPMTDRPFPRRAGQRVMNTGTRGGRVKATTGYAFLRIQRDSAAIVASLLRHGHPFAVPASPARYRVFDALMLEILCRQGGDCHEIYSALFAANPIRRVFRFLDEEGSWWENLRLVATLPPGPFVGAVWGALIIPPAPFFSHSGEKKGGSGG